MPELQDPSLNILKCRSTLSLRGAVTGRHRGGTAASSDCPHPGTPCCSPSLGFRCAAPGWKPRGLSLRWPPCSQGRAGSGGGRQKLRASVCQAGGQGSSALGRASERRLPLLRHVHAAGRAAVFAPAATAHLTPGSRRCASASAASSSPCWSRLGDRQNGTTMICGTGAGRCRCGMGKGQGRGRQRAAQRACLHCQLPRCLVASGPCWL
jgi:hypothetical protein